MSDPFRARIRQALADSTLQAALDANAQRRLAARAAATASLPDWSARRQRAHAVRAEVIDHLERYLDQFLTQLHLLRVTVHRAQDAQEACQQVLAILHQTAGPNALIAKAKSMVSEEIGLNHALEAAGHRVVETDLGEYIIQLRGERPSHIITPAVHLSRQQVGQLFHQKLGVPYTDDIPTLTQTARAVLRQVFLTADVGLTGVNFGVAENGALVTVTNEGNGRMVSTLPRVHIALMGMERLVPTLDDLALLLSLLPRSATGQKLSVYTQLLRAPRPGQQRHVIVVDNGRSRLRASPLREALYCIRCGACLNACPVFRELGGHGYINREGAIAPYPGPIGSIVSPGLFGASFVHLAQASSLCGACREACPVDIDLPKLLIRVRAGQLAPPSARKPAPTPLPFALALGLKLYARLARHPSLFAASQIAAALGARLLSPFSPWLRLPAWTGWGESRDLPRPALRPFRLRFGNRPLPAPAPSAEPSPRIPLSTEAGPTPSPPTQTAPSPSLAERFHTELTALGGGVIRCTWADLAHRLTEILEERQITHVFVDDFGARHLPSGFAPVRHPDPALAVGLTGCAAGIANTGTVLLLDEGESFKASLLPATHLVILPSDRLAADLSEALLLTRHAANAVLITGPSRTADIEMTLTIGVHGPKEMLVFLVDDSSRR